MLLRAHKGPQRFPDWANRCGGAGEDIHCGDDDNVADVHHDGGEDGDDASQDNDPHHQDILGWRRAGNCQQRDI